MSRRAAPRCRLALSSTRDQAPRSLAPIAKPMSSVAGLQVHLHTREGERFAGQCTDLESHLGEVTALVEFDSGGAPVVPLGEAARLTIRGDWLAAPIETDAAAVLRTDSRAQRCYSFRLRSVSKALLMLLANRRSSDRLRPPAAKPACVRILDVAEEASEAIVHDISATGISILIEPELEKRLSASSHLRISVSLPDSGTVEACAIIRHRRLFGSAVLYGLEFDGQIPGFLGSQERLLSYLTSLRTRRT